MSMTISETPRGGSNLENHGEDRGRGEITGRDRNKEEKVFSSSSGGFRRRAVSPRRNTRPQSDESARGLLAVPVYNEAGSLPRVLALLDEIEEPLDRVFIDDGSSDESRAILERAGEKVIRHPVNLGYVEALRTAVGFADREGYAFVVFFDGDGQHRPCDLEGVVRCHRETGADFVLGSRFLKGRRRMTPRHFVNFLMARIVTLLAGVKLTDSSSGLKLISRRFFDPAMNLPLEDMHGELVYALVRAGAEFREVPIEVAEREEGESMYHLTKALLYPLKTILCLLAAKALVAPGERAAS
ncbi:MAG: glycosyltransferase family 2 protein [Candidatus Hydrogenedentota bacterium]|nr:MAG: glycosyltransferase family 2 protein [Candidatus Hydrogenedentota bacterium]